MSSLNQLMRLLNEVEQLETSVKAEEPMSEEESIWWEISERLEKLCRFPQDRLDFLALVLGDNSPERDAALAKFQETVGFSIVDDMNPICVRDWYIYLKGDHYWLKNTDLTEDERQRYDALVNVLGWNSDTWPATYGFPRYWRDIGETHVIDG